MIAEPASLVPLLGIGALVVGALVARLPVSTCPECPHCRAAAIQAAAEQRRLSEEHRRRAGIPPRLWGRREDDRGEHHDDQS